jgi:hypothetical protein
MPVIFYCITLTNFVYPNRWIDQMFPLLDTSTGKCTVWDSCRAHISRAVKAHCANRRIELIVIPGGLTPYLQAGDIGIYRDFKDPISDLIDQWKRSDGVQYTRGGNPKPPSDTIVQGWVRDAWSRLSINNVRESILLAGFNDNPDEWHISKHDIYGSHFKTAYKNTRNDIELSLEDFKEVEQEDDIEDVMEE